MRRKLLRKKMNAEMKEFRHELRARKSEGYSVRQLIKSHIPDIGTEVKIADSEVTTALRKHQVAHFESPPETIIFLLGGATSGGRNPPWGVPYAGLILRCLLIELT